MDSTLPSVFVRGLSSVRHSPSLYILCTLAISIKHTGLEGSLLIKFSCTECSERMLTLVSSVEIEFSRCARTNLFYCLLQAETDPKAFASSLNILGTYHACDTHSWEGGQCGFHSLKSCTCGECGNEVICEGEDYHTKNPLTCLFHKLAYQIECYNRVCQASQIIHTELGRGHSNYPEASHDVLTIFRAKDKYLQQIYYIVSTDMGLLWSNMTWLTRNRRIEESK